jgi:hypothetical protein
VAPKKEGRSRRTAQKEKSFKMPNLNHRPSKGNSNTNPPPCSIGKFEAKQEQLAITPLISNKEPDNKSAADIDPVDNWKPLSAPGPRREETGGPYDFTGDNPSVVILHQFATAVYINPYGQVVIRQEDQYGDEENEDTVFINKNELPRLISKLQEFASEFAAEAR